MVMFYGRGHPGGRVFSVNGRPGGLRTRMEVEIGPELDPVRGPCVLCRC